MTLLLCCASGSGILLCTCGSTGRAAHVVSTQMRAAKLCSGPTKSRSCGLPTMFLPVCTLQGLLGGLSNVIEVMRGEGAPPTAVRAVVAGAL
jgi:hypothetical protein